MAHELVAGDVDPDIDGARASAHNRNTPLSAVFEDRATVRVDHEGAGRT
jgi:hypothetical protein